MPGGGGLVVVQVAGDARPLLFLSRDQPVREVLQASMTLTERRLRLRPMPAFDQGHAQQGDERDLLAVKSASRAVYDDPASPLRHDQRLSHGRRSTHHPVSSLGDQILSRSPSATDPETDGETGAGTPALSRSMTCAASS